MYNIPNVKVQLVRDGNTKTQNRPVIREPQDAYDILKETCALHCEEHFYCLLLSTKNHVNAIHEVSIGTLNAAVVHPREVFKAAILSNAAAVILVHNHPSGDPAPSKEDIELTRRLIDAGKLLDIPVLDHVIIGDWKYYSMKESGIL